MPEEIKIDFFNFSRSGITFQLTDDDDNPIDVLTVWDKVELHIFSQFNPLVPVLVRDPDIDDSIVSTVFSSEEMLEYFSASGYRIEVRLFSGGDYDTEFFYNVGTKTVYQ